MKKLICFLLTLIMLFSFAGCYNDNNEKSEQQTKPNISKYTETYESEENGDDVYTNTYILNTSSYKFHYTYCGSVKLMSSSNKKVYRGSRTEVISMGYVACLRCCP